MRLNILKSLSKPFSFQIRQYSAITSQAIRGVPSVVISDDPEIRYILVTIYEHGAKGINKTILRGEKAKRHTHIYYKLRKQMKDIGLCTEAVGGAKLLHDKECKVFTIFGTSETFGTASCDKTRSLLLTKYTDYKVRADKAKKEGKAKG